MAGTMTELAPTHGARWCKGYPLNPKPSGVRGEPPQTGDVVGCAELRCCYVLRLAKTGPCRLNSGLWGQRWAVVSVVGAWFGGRCHRGRCTA